MNIFEDTDARALKDLLAEIHNRTSALPDFQRDFVWDPSATQELIVSIANNYPAGSILRVRDAKRVFKAREFEGAPALGDAKHTFLVLDGQQRLTSLYQAFYGVGDHRYYLDLRKLQEQKDFEEAIFHLRATTKWAKALEAFEIQARDLTMPLQVVLGGVDGALTWLLRVTDGLGEGRTQTLDALRSATTPWISAIVGYRFPVVTLSDQTEPAALCTIFETLNRTGVKLSVFELLTARFWPHNIDLRELWRKARAEFPIVTTYEVDPYYILQAIALACRPAPSCKRGDVLNLEPTEIAAWWDKVVAAMVRGLELLRDGCHVMLPKWLPYQTMLPPLAAAIAKAGDAKTAMAGARYEKIKRWFWCSVFGQTYESAPNSRSAKDVAELLSWFAGGAEPEAITRFTFDPQALRDVSPRQRAIYRGTICLILGHGAKDFHTQSLISGKVMDEQGIDDHHIFPAAYLDRSLQIPPRSRDCVLNRTLIDRATNQMISDRAPSDYLAEIRATEGFPFASVLASHMMPGEEHSSFFRNNFEEFLAWRQSQLWGEIQGVTGAKAATPLEATVQQTV